MELEKAIEILEDMRNVNLNYYSPDRKDALKLGIEALKREAEMRKKIVDEDIWVLPGETED